MGSACIATWLRTNNTCPLCRRILFRAHQERHTDPSHSLGGEDRWINQPAPDVLPLPGLAVATADLCTEFCEELGLSQSTSNVARQMIEHEDPNVELVTPTPRLQALVVSTVLFMVTHIMDEYRSLEEISMVSGVQADIIRGIYRRIHPSREHLITSNMLGALSGGSVQDFLDLLPPPNAENGFEGHEEGGCDLEHYLIPAHSKQLEELCVQYSHELDHFEGFRGICLDIARRIRAGPYLGGLSPLPVFAVSLYMASHLASSGTTIRQVSEIVGISEGTIRNAYRSLYPRFGELIDSDMLEMHEEVRRHRVLQAITWPAV